MGKGVRAALTNDPKTYLERNPVPSLNESRLKFLSAFLLRMRFNPYARITAELVGTVFLLMAVVCSGIMGERLCGARWDNRRVCRSAALPAAWLRW
jgi:hypothetical protein